MSALTPEITKSDESMFTKSSSKVRVHETEFNEVTEESLRSILNSSGGVISTKTPLPSVVDATSAPCPETEPTLPVILKSKKPEESEVVISRVAVITEPEIVTVAGSPPIITSGRENKSSVDVASNVTMSEVVACEDETKLFEVNVTDV